MKNKLNKKKIQKKERKISDLQQVSNGLRGCEWWKREGWDLVEEREKLETLKVKWSIDLGLAVENKRQKRQEIQEKRKREELNIYVSDNTINQWCRRW